MTFNDVWTSIRTLECASLDCNVNYYVKLVSLIEIVISQNIWKFFKNFNYLKTGFQKNLSKSGKVMLPKNVFYRECH